MKHISLTLHPQTADIKSWYRGRESRTIEGPKTDWSNAHRRLDEHFNEPLTPIIRVYCTVCVLILAGFIFLWN